MRTANATDFFVDVENVGRFRFGRRTMRDELRIGVEYSRLTEGVDTPTEFLALFAGIIAALTVLTVEAPKGWDIEAMDPLDQDSYNQLMEVHAALRAKEADFRRSAKAERQEDGQESREELPVLVPSEVQPAAE